MQVAPTNNVKLWVYANPSVLIKSIQHRSMQQSNYALLPFSHRSP